MSDYFFDTEFQENGPHNPIDFISIGIIDEDGRAYYAVSSEFNEASASDWIKENVIPRLGVEEEEKKPLKQIASEILKFVGDDESPSFIADYGAYDWVVFCQLFGKMIDLPDYFPKHVKDVQQLYSELKLTEELPTLEAPNEHNALSDAKECKLRWEYLKKKKFISEPFNAKEFLKKMKQRKS